MSEVIRRNLFSLSSGTGFRMKNPNLIGRVVEGNDCEVKVEILREGDLTTQFRNWSPFTEVEVATVDLTCPVVALECLCGFVAGSRPGLSNHQKGCMPYRRSLLSDLK